MFCTNCGKNINNERVCPFCGTTQELCNMQNQATPFINQPISQQEFMQNQLSISEDSVIPENLKFGVVEKDKEFNVMALIFGWFWLIYNKMWQAVIVSIILILISFMPIIGEATSYIGIIWNIFWGARGNYYKRLQNDEKIGFINAIQKRLY